MNIGIVTTWFERGAAYVSKQFEEVLEKEHNISIYARGGEEYAIGDLIWDKENVTWGKKIDSAIVGTLIDKNDFKNWIRINEIELIIFNEQQWFQPLLWCKEWGIKTVAYIDYYTERTIPLFAVYDLLICNTKRHFSAFSWHKGAIYLPWGANVELFKPNNYINNLVNEKYVTFFHSCGMNHERKGTKFLLEAFVKAKKCKKLVIHTQKDFIDKNLVEIIKRLEDEGRLQILNKTVPAPGLFHLGDVYVYPTILEGIGLTIAEALSSGLATIVTNNGPMNEFVVEELTGKLINIERYYARHDGYYWPACIPDISDLVTILNQMADNIDEVIEMKKNAREYAIENLSFDKNMGKLNSIISSVEIKQINNETLNLINRFDNSGFKKFIKYYTTFPSFFNFFKKYI